MATSVIDPGCLIPRPDIRELHSAINAEMSTRLLGGAQVLALSGEDILSWLMAGTVNLNYGHITQALKELDPATACCDNLVRYAARHGIDLRGATRAKGYALLTGTPGAPIPATLRLIGESSRQYKLDPGVSFNPVTLSSTGSAALRIVATLPGGEFNLPTGRHLTVGTTVPGIDIDATVVGNGLTGGTSDEDCESLRRRVLAEERSPLVLNEEWYLRQTLRYPGVTRACTDACQGCCDPQRMVIYPFMEGVYGADPQNHDLSYRVEPYGVPPCEVLDEMTEWMFGLEPGRGQGLAPFGIRGSYQRAIPAPISVTARCYRGCPIGGHDRVRDALWQELRFRHCVGSTLCKEQLRAVINRAIGVDNCISDIQFHYDPGYVRWEDAASIYLDCGIVAVLGAVNLTEGQQ